MAWVHHESSQLHSSDYDGNEQTLRVRFHCKCKGADANCNTCGGKGHGEPYTYYDVPEAAWVAVRDGESVGAAFNTHIKKGGYKFERPA